MSNRDENHSLLDDRLLDHLVDGELAEPQRRDVLARLEREPGGWRRCALAFLQAQCWSDALGSVVSESAPDELPVESNARIKGHALKDETCADPEFGPSRRRREVPFRTAMKVAAGLLVAFLTGTAAGRLSLSRPRADGPLAQSASPSDPDSAPSAAAGTGTSGVADPRPKGAAFAVLDLGGAAGSERVTVPILAGPGLDERWLKRQPSAVPKHLQREWERQGYEVEQHRRLVSVSVRGGPRVSIPVDEVELHFIGQRAY
jgi:hypothetical protein